MTKAESVKNKADNSLSEYVLHHNYLGNNFLQALSRNIANDTYVRKIDLQHNSFKSEKAILNNEFVNEIYSNESLINLDLRNNKGYTPKVARKLALCMLKMLIKLVNLKPVLNASGLNPK